MGRFLCCFAAFCVALSVHGAEPAETFDAFLKAQVPAKGPGFAVGIANGSRVEFLRGYGGAHLADSRPVGSRTRFELASVTKQFTGFAVLLLNERGKLRYDDAITRFLPELPPFAKKITVRHLLQHTGGLPEYFDLCTAGRPLTNVDVLKFVVALKQPLFPAGERELYSNTAYSLLAIIVERVSGESFPEFLKEHVLLPAGMTRSFVNVSATAPGDDVALSYGSGPAFLPHTEPAVLDCNSIYGDGSLYATAEDMLRWNLALDEVRLTTALAQADAFLPTTTNAGVAVPYGFGWRLTPVAGRDAVWHTGAWAGFHNWNTRFANGWRVIVLTNYDDSPLDAIMKKAVELFLPVTEVPSAATE